VGPPLLAELSQVMRDASICGLGQAAPNPVDCVLRHFRTSCLTARAREAITSRSTAAKCRPAPARR
jgi:NADH:ubiquinone oxidoreductase subunit F (NADH-binding)